MENLNPCRLTVYILISLSLLVCFSTATVIRVPDDYPTIQQGLNAAQNGDTVLVAANTYSENIAWPSQDGIVLLSEDGAQTTIIDGNLSGRVINFPNYSFSTNTIIKGFTIQNGTAEKGGGLYTYGSPQILGNIIQRNIAQGTSTWVYGGGIHCDGSGSPYIIANEFTGNVAIGEYWNYGGGIYIDNDVSAQIIGNVFSHDSTIGGYWNYGAGIYCDGYSYPDIRHNVIFSNVAYAGDRGYGVGMYIDDNCPAYLLSNLIYDNTANSGTWNYGAGIYINDSTMVFNNTIVNNICTGAGSQYGGGVYISDSGNVVGNNIIVGNSSTYGGGIGCNPNGHAELLNNNVWNNTPDNYYNISPGANDISVDPLFVTGSMGDFYLSQTAAGQGQDSPCVDYGFATAESLQLDTYTTRTDTVYDQGTVDLGYHYPTQPFVRVEELEKNWLVGSRTIYFRVCPTITSDRFIITLECHLPQNVTIQVFDNTGRSLRSIHTGKTTKGVNNWTWPGRDNKGDPVPAGVYFIIAHTDNGKMLTEKVLLLK